ALLQKEGIRFCPRDQEPLERRERHVDAQKDIKKLVSALGRQGIDPELAVIGLAAPRVLIFGTIADEQQNAMAREALHQVGEYRLRLRIGPVEILKHENDPSVATLLKEQQLHGLQRPAPLLLRIQRPPLCIVDWHIEERENSGDRRRQPSLK